MSKLRKVAPCKLEVARVFNQNSNLITLSENDLDDTIAVINLGDSAAAAAKFLILQLKDVKYNLEQGNLDPRGIYRGFKNGKKAIQHLKYLNRNFNLSKDIKRNLDLIITSTSDFFKVSKSELDKLKREADNFVSPEEKKEVSKSKDLLLAIAYELHLSEFKNQLEELLLSVYIRVLPLVSEYKESIGKRAFEKTMFGSKGIFCFNTLANNFPRSPDDRNLKLLLNALPFCLLAKFFKGFSLTINDDSTVTVFCQGRAEFYEYDDQRDYVHPRRGNPLFSDEHNNWFKENMFEPISLKERIIWEKKREEILSNYDNKDLYPPRKSDYYLLLGETDEPKEICYNTITLKR